MASALRMPTVIECMTAELMGLVREGEKASLGLVEQLKEELEKVRPFKVYGEVDLMVEKLEVEELKIPPKEGGRKVKAEKMEKMRKKQMKYMQAQKGEEVEEKSKEELECIVCRQGQNEENLLCLVLQDESSLLSEKLGLKGGFLYFKGCMHPIHSSCVNKPLDWCPLCKKPTSSCPTPLPILSTLKSISWTSSPQQL